MRKYTLVDNASGEETSADADKIERVTGVEIGYIDWVLEQTRNLKTGTGKYLHDLKEIALFVATGRLNVLIP